MNKNYFSIKGREEFYRIIEENKRAIDSFEDSELKKMAYAEINNTIKNYESSRINYLNNKIQEINDREKRKKEFKKGLSEYFNLVNESLSNTLSLMKKNIEDNNKNVSKLNKFIECQKVLQRSIEFNKDNSRFFNGNSMN